MQLSGWKALIKQEKLLSVRMGAASVRVLGLLNTSLLQDSIEVVMRRHESLRTRFVMVDGVPRQHIEPPCEYHLKVVDLAAVSSIKMESKAKRLAQEFADERIDLSVGPLFEAKLLRLSERDHVLISLVDHMVSDAFSWAILSKEIWASYNQAAQGLPISLPKLPIQFADYAVWQQCTYSAWLEQHEAYWRGRLTGAPCIQLQHDDGLAEVQHSTGGMLHFPLGKALTARLREVAQREGTLLSMVVLTVYISMMSRWCNEGDLVVRVTSHGRHGRPELANMIGFLSTNLHCRVELSKKDSFVDLLKRVSLEFYSAHQHQDFDRVPYLFPECSTELFFNWLPTNWTRTPVNHRREADDSLTIQPFPLEVRAPGTKYFCPVFSDTAAGVVVTVWYPADRFAKRTIERFGHNLRLFATEFAQRPHASAASIALSP
jgi:hypothetical protein